MKLNAGGREETAARQERQVPMKARSSRNELRRAIICRSRLSRRSAQTSGPDMEVEVELEAWQVFLRGLSGMATSLQNTEK